MHAVHPRECGGNKMLDRLVGTLTGPSPRVRGKRRNSGPVRRSRGSVPASAGETVTTSDDWKIVRVHPRECGGNRSRHLERDSLRGPSPRVRGKPLGVGHLFLGHGSIPASAGETASVRGSAHNERVHPRECGGNKVAEGAVVGVLGPSPRVRGKHLAEVEITAPSRSIPASAGETRGFAPSRTVYRVHPRECGGNAETGTAQRPATGPSPRVRGKRLRGHQHGAHRRSIPASAGETPGPERPHHAVGVHPRECGGNATFTAAAGPANGPSPRVRGKRGQPEVSPRRVGSIPASAGETHECQTALRDEEVHPRECGGNTRMSNGTARRRGPSPRVRGKHLSRGGAGLAFGSIPASAGETSSTRLTRYLSGVHPRECGGNTPANPQTDPPTGPSPRVRGKRLPVVRRPDQSGSIPASAGETAAATAAGMRKRVHPRECGGNVPSWVFCAMPPGPSPRVRGKLPISISMSRILGSIPASAGETTPSSPGWPKAPVHPRECGGNPTG